MFARQGPGSIIIIICLELLPKPPKTRGRPYQYQLGSSSRQICWGGKKKGKKERKRQICSTSRPSSSVSLSSEAAQTRPLLPCRVPRAGVARTGAAQRQHQTGRKPRQSQARKKHFQMYRTDRPRLHCSFFFFFRSLTTSVQMAGNSAEPIQFLFVNTSLSVSCSLGNRPRAWGTGVQTLVAAWL